MSASEVGTRELVRRRLAAGLSRAEVARELGLSKGTVSYHARRLGEEVDARCARRYDWAAVQAYYDAGHSVRECQEQFGFSRGSWHDAVNRGEICARPVGMPLDTLFRDGVPRSRRNLKLRLIAAGIKEAKCEECGLSEWREQPLSLELHHINGVGDDNRLENLRLLCPNCHSQTDTWGGRNIRSRAS